MFRKEIVLLRIRLIKGKSSLENEEENILGLRDEGKSRASIARYMKYSIYILA